MKLTLFSAKLQQELNAEIMRVFATPEGMGMRVGNKFSVKPAEYLEKIEHFTWFCRGRFFIFPYELPQCHLKSSLLFH